MDLSGLKWPLIIAVVVAVGWLMSSGGVNYMIGKFTEATPGVDPEQDKIDEAGLSKVSSYLITLFRYEKCAQVLELTIDRYGPTAPNYWNNLSRLSTCYDRMGEHQKAIEVLDFLIDNNADQLDERVPTRDALVLRVNKLKEMHQRL